MTRLHFGALSAISAAILVGFIFVSDGFFIVDETIYFLGAYAFQSTGSFFLENGQSEFASDDLRLWLLRDTPSGLTPQYPPGSAVLGALFMPVLGLKGMMVGNVIAAIGTLFATYFLTQKLFDERRAAFVAVVLLALCSFFVEYAYGYWPHAISVCLLTLALFAAVSALDQATGAMGWAALAGLLTGAAIWFRVDAVLILPFFVFAAVLYGKQPIHILGGGALGLIPGCLTLGLINQRKFGTFNPLSYGHDAGGATDVSEYAFLFAPAVVGLAALIWVRLKGMPRASVMLVGFGGVVGLMAVVAPLRELGLDVLRGLYFLGLRLNDVPDARPGVERYAQITMFWGLPKKALVQSLPWLGLLSLMLVMPKHTRHRSVVLVLVFSLLWSLPYLIRSWHGGLGSNMRYLLPTLPVLSALAGWVLSRLLDDVEGWGRPVTFGTIFGVALAFAYTGMAASGPAAAHQILPLGLAGLLCVMGLFYVVPIMRSAILGVTAASLGLSGFLGLSDLLNAQVRRAQHAVQSEAMTRLPHDILVYGIAEELWPAVLNTEQVVAMPNIKTNAIDGQLVEAAFASGRRVVLMAHLAPEFEAAGFVTQAPSELSVFGLIEALPR